MTGSCSRPALPLRVLAIAAIGAAAVLTGCGNDGQADLQDYVRKVKSRTPAPIEPLPEIPQISTFVFEPSDRRDPFVADTKTNVAVDISPNDSLAPDRSRRKEELEGYALDSLRMVGTLEQNETKWGLIRTQDGALHRVRVGNYMGQNDGQITSIRDDAILLTEVVSEAPGVWRERQATVSLTQ
jgi:type IV pilus assembly protein PilP